MVLKKTLRERIRLLADPQNFFEKISGMNFERQVHEYLILLCFGGFLGAVVMFISHVVRGVYVSIFHAVSIQYWPLVNYAGGNASAVFFFYLFAGTFLLFVVSLLVRPFTRRIRYVHLMNLLFFAFTPLILFAWIIPAIPGLLIWSIVLMIIGIRTINTQMLHQDRTSITQRD